MRIILLTGISGSGKSVGLPNGQMGNSEVGHLNIGAGRVVLLVRLGLEHRSVQLRHPNLRVR